MKRVFILFLLFIAPAVFAQVADSSYLYGIHWYGDYDATDVESMTGGKGVWVLEHTMLDTTGVGNFWEEPAYKVTPAQKMTNKGHSLIFRIQPNWSRNVPHSSDPYTLANYADGCKTAANTLKSYCHVWVIGNEVNLNGENKYWDGDSYDASWTPTPEQYAAAYIACRDKIHEVTPTTNPATQMVLMQPVSPGKSLAGVRYLGGCEFLWRQINAVTDKSKIDGFAIHGYAEPGGTNYGIDGYWESIREQLMVIDSFGLGDRPVFITEWNKHMPNVTEAKIGAKFLHNAFTYMNAWNTGSGGEWPGLSNHNIVGTTWFVYPSGSWNEYSLLYWKNNTGTVDEENDPWKSFQYSCGQNYSRGAYGGGPAVPQGSLWWEDDFTGSSLDTSAPLPHWKAETSASGSVVMSGSGSVRFLGNGSSTGGGGIRTAGYVYDNFYLEADITFTNVAQANTATTEANFDIRLREEDKGYSITMFTSASPTNPNKIILRRTNDWLQIGSFSTTVSGGINNGDNFIVTAVANGSSIQIKIYKNGGTTPVVDWNVADSGQHTGWIRLMTYNMNEAQVNKVKLGGASYISSSVKDWEIYK